MRGETDSLAISRAATSTPFAPLGILSVSERRGWRVNRVRLGKSDSARRQRNKSILRPDPNGDPSNKGDSVFGFRFWISDYEKSLPKNLEIDPEFAIATKNKRSLTRLDDEAVRPTIYT